MKKKSIIRTALLLSSVTVGSEVLAQSITYAPAASAIPTVSEWGLIILSLILAVAAFTVLRNKNSKAVMALFMTGAIVLAAGGGGRLVNEAWATLNPTLSTSTGGVLDLSGYNDEFRVNGHPTVAMRIVDVSPTSLSTQGSPTCAPGLVVNAGGVCYLRFNSCGATSTGAVAGATC